MQTFEDGMRRKWSFRIDFGKRQLIKSQTGCDVLQIDSDIETLERFASDIELLAEVIWILCGDEASKRSVSMESFSEGLTNEVFAKFRDLLFEEVAAFIQCLQPQRGERLRAAVEAMKKAGEELMGLQAQQARNLIDLLNSELTSSSDTSSSLQESSV